MFSILPPFSVGVNSVKIRKKLFIKQKVLFFKKRPFLEGPRRTGNTERSNSSKCHLNIRF